jgi:CheY-like chemotaxis protein
VTDISLGAKGTGWEVARRARELNPNLAVVYMSGDSAAEWHAQGVPQSVMVPKPFAPTQVVVAVASLANTTDTD